MSLTENSAFFIPQGASKHADGTFILGKRKTIGTMEEQGKCKGGHKVDGKDPMLEDIHLDGRTCDCGKLIYRAEECGCPSNRHMELKKYPNT